MYVYKCARTYTCTCMCVRTRYVFYVRMYLYTSPHAVCGTTLRHWHRTDALVRAHNTSHPELCRFDAQTTQWFVINLPQIRVSKPRCHGVCDANKIDDKQSLWATLYTANYLFMTFVAAAPSAPPTSVSATAYSKGMVLTWTVSVGVVVM